MTVRAKSHGERAMEAALEAMPGCHPGTAAIVLLFTAAKAVRAAYGAETAAELAYQLADGLVTGSVK